MQNNKKGNIAIFNREKRSALQNSTFIEDIFSDSDAESDAENVSHTQWRTVDDSVPNELSTLASCSLSNGTDMADFEDAEDHDSKNGSSDVKSEANGFADDSVIVIDDD